MPKKQAKQRPSIRKMLLIALSILLLLLVPVYAYQANWFVPDPEASTSQPVITHRFSDSFTANTLNRDAWDTIVVTNPGSPVMRPLSGNLRLRITEEKTGNLIVQHKQKIQPLSDFRADAYMYRPQSVNKDAEVIGSLMFRTNKMETVSVSWIVKTGSKDKLRFRVMDNQNKVLFERIAEVNTERALVRMIRVKNEYRALYKTSHDDSADTAWTSLGSCRSTCAQNLGAEGAIALRVTNSDKTPKPSTFELDKVVISWQNGQDKPEPVTVESFTDAFENADLAKQWVTNKSANEVVITESKSQDLTIRLPENKKGDTAYIGRIARRDPVVALEKEFTYTAHVFKPAVTGQGSGDVAIGFRSATEENKESARILWRATEKDGDIRFVVRNEKGEDVEVGRVANIKFNKVWLQLQRINKDGNNYYRAFYRVGDDDNKWIQVGKDAAEESLGESGRLFIYGRSLQGVTSGNPYTPSVIVRVDEARATIKK